MIETYAVRGSGHWALMALLAAGVLTACELGKVQEPWVSGSQYQQERARSPETANELRHRILYNQIDR
ncbi:MAG: hypothetical protein PVG98_06205 [Chromatiales bacterium]